MTKKDKEEWWKAVRVCLRTFHGKTPRQAAAMARECRKRMDRPFPGSPKGVGVLQYHEEPFHLAESLTGQNINLTNDEYMAQYIVPILGV